jgi:uncharacterized protein YndB with AHSA1/START domain
MSQETVIEETKLVIKRTFDAPVEKVYQAWTDPAKMVQWMSPNVRWRSPAIDIDVKPGGRHNLTMRHSDGDEVPVTGHYVEVVPNERISLTWKWPQAQGGDDTLLTVEFRAVPEGTELTLTHDRQSGRDAVKGTSEGWTGFMEMLETYLEGTPPLHG